MLLTPFFGGGPKGKPEGHRLSRGFLILTPNWGAESKYPGSNIRQRAAAWQAAMGKRSSPWSSSRIAVEVGAARFPGLVGFDRPFQLLGSVSLFLLCRKFGPVELSFYWGDV